jgi:SAM-dependent methyltransferase
MSSNSEPTADEQNRILWSQTLQRNRMRYPDEQVVRFLARNYGNPPRPAHRTGLDVGCGSGRHTATLVRFGFDATGIDYAPDVIASTGEEFDREGIPARFETTDLSSLAGRGERFDCAIAWGVLFLRPVDAMCSDLAALRAVLKPGGLLLANFHTEDSWMRGLGSEVAPATWRLDERAHEYAGMTYTFLPPAVSRGLLVGAGFEVFEEERVEYWKKARQRLTWSVYYARVPAP